MNNGNEDLNITLTCNSFIIGSVLGEATKLNPHTYDDNPGSMSDHKHRSLIGFLSVTRCPYTFQKTIMMFYICFINIEATAGSSKVDHANHKRNYSKHVIEAENPSRINVRATREHGGIFSIKGKAQQVRWSFPLKQAW